MDMHSLNCVVQESTICPRHTCGYVLEDSNNKRKEQPNENNSNVHHQWNEKMWQINTKYSTAVK